MGDPDHFIRLRRLLGMLGLTEERREDLLDWVAIWLHEDATNTNGRKPVPYGLRPAYLTVAEQNFYRVLLDVTRDTAVVCTKVCLDDLFDAQTGDFSQNTVYRQQIKRRRVDFLLLDTRTLQPLLGIQLEETGLKTAVHSQRDHFVDEVFAAAGLPLVHITARHHYPADRLARLLRQRARCLPAPNQVPEERRGAGTPECPRCGATMVLRTMRNGPRRGQPVWGCATFPTCREIQPVADGAPFSSFH